MSREIDKERVLGGATKLLTDSEIRLMKRLYLGSDNLCRYPTTYKKLYDYYTDASELGYYDKRKNNESPVTWVMNQFKEVLNIKSEKGLKRFKDFYIYKLYQKKGLPIPSIKK